MSGLTSRMYQQRQELMSDLAGFTERAPGQSTRITLSGLSCTGAILALGISLQASHGTFDGKSLALIFVSIGFCCFGVGGSRAVVILPFNKQGLVQRIFVGAVVVYLLVSLAILRSRHTPIDVVVFEDDSVESLLHGSDPYGGTVTHVDIYSTNPNLYNSPASFYAPGVSVNGRVHVGFPYPPLTLLWIIPGYFAGDVRLSFMLAILLSAFLVFDLAPDLNGLTAALLLMFAPATQHVLTLGWTEPLMVLTLAGTIYCAKKSPALLPVALGLFFASKQYSLLALPIVGLLLPKFSWKSYLWLLVTAGAVGGVLSIPFLYWDPRGFWQSLVAFHLASPFRLDALSLPALFARHGFHAIPEWGALLGVAIGIGFALKKAPRTAGGFAASLALISLIFFILNKQAFCNYYFFCAGALCIALSASEYNLSDTLFGLVRLSR